MFASVPVRWWLHLGVGGLVFLAYAWSGQFWLDMVDEGYFLDLASRVYHGQLPYRDFDTYYTPGIFYLFAGVFHVFGVSVMPVRHLMAVLRVLCAVLLVRLTLRCAPWPFALLPMLIVTALDRWPIEPEPHPSWPAITACLLTMDLIAEHQATRRRRWLVLAGTTAGLAFLFKQNVGAFTALGVAGYVVLHSRDSVGSLLRALREVFALTLGIVATVFLWPALDSVTALALWLPLVLTLGLLTRQACHASENRDEAAGLRATLGETALTAAAFALVTALWLSPLIVALSPASPPLGLFFGLVNQAGLASPFPALSRGAPALIHLSVWLIAGLALVSGAATPRARWRVVAAAAAASILVQLAPVVDTPQQSLTGDPWLAAWLDRLNEEVGTLHVYLPALAAWAALVALLLGAPVARGGPPPWFLLFGTLSMLSLYPRADTPHVVVASPPILVVGAWAFSSFYRAMTARGRLWSILVSITVLAITIAAVAPQVLWRYATVAYPPRNPPRAAYVPLALDRAAVFLPRQTAETLREVVMYIDAGTPPGAPFFAYPAAPLFNFLVDRPNPSRFTHFLPGALTAQDFRQVIAALDAARPRYVLWDHGGVIYWETDPVNRPLSDYIWRCYRLVATFDFYLVLERQEC